MQGNWREDVTRYEPTLNNRNTMMTGLKQVILLLTLSLLMVSAMTYMQQVVQVLLAAHDWVSQLLTEVFSLGQAGNIARGLLALLTIPVGIALVPTGVYWMLRRHWFPYFIEIVWIIWLLQAGALLVYNTNSV